MTAVITLLAITGMLVVYFARDRYWQDRLVRNDQANLIETERRLTERDREHLEERQGWSASKRRLREQREAWVDRCMAAEGALEAKVVFQEREVIPIHDMTPAEEDREHRRLAERMVTGIAREIARKGTFEVHPLDPGNPHSPKTSTLTVYLKDLL